MKKSILCLILVLALCLCLCTLFVACDEEPETEPPVEDPVPETPEEEEAPAEDDDEGDKKGQFHPTPGAGGADVNAPEPNEQLPDSTGRY